MRFEELQALRDLDKRTPPYYVAEIFAHGDLTMRRRALRVLTTLDPSRCSARVLVEMLKIITKQETQGPG